MVSSSSNRTPRSPFHVNFSFSSPSTAIVASEGIHRQVEGRRLRRRNHGAYLFLGRLMAKLAAIIEPRSKYTGCFYLLHNGPWYWGSAGVLRAERPSLHMTAPTSAGSARLPGVIPAGAQSERNNGWRRYHPTFASFAGVPVPASADIDGSGYDARPDKTRKVSPGRT